jgi:hypothetical protein
METKKDIVLSPASLNPSQGGTSQPHNTGFSKNLLIDQHIEKLKTMNI